LGGQRYIVAPTCVAEWSFGVLINRSNLLSGIFGPPISQRCGRAQRDDEARKKTGHGAASPEISVPTPFHLWAEKRAPEATISASVLPSQ